MINLNFSDEGSIHTVLTGDRSKMNKGSINNSKADEIVEHDIQSDEDYENDMPYFYQLGKF